ncbi:hypothetical protein KHA94_09140 [Bacillus sp. FJAT-49705]|uniref:DUF3888 domain-containing protein n=1 Tax=Cytobacillus citreus TaxID=2833586 RepID=A0ABS5NRC3_9BACI|nr:hypothetical protein [Cytobacillus citreus]MBS4190365.1 hypothetical protein [Cytobacillus citreus]
MIRLYAFIVFSFLVLSLNYVTYAESENNYKYMDNKEKHFISAEEFFRSYPGYSQNIVADIILRKKVLYKNLEDFIKSNVTKHYFINLYNVYAHPHTGVSPHRQIYFYCAIWDNDKTLEHKYIIVDAETGEYLVRGSGVSYEPVD